MAFKVIPLTDEPALELELWDDDLTAAWPRFMLEDPLANLYFAEGRFARFKEFALVAYDDDTPNTLLGRAFSVPFCFGEAFGRTELPDGGWDTVVRWADQDHFLGRTPNAVSALEITLRPQAQGRGLSVQVVQAMCANAKRLGFGDLFAPVRPSHKAQQPNKSVQAYAFELRDDGLPVDPWLRVHVRAGGRIIKVAPHSMVVAGSLAAWRAWTGLPFNKDGPCAVPGALVPVYVSLTQNHAVYVEPNVWVRHRLGA